MFSEQGFARTTAEILTEVCVLQFKVMPELQHCFLFKRDKTV